MNSNVFNSSMVKSFFIMRLLKDLAERDLDRTRMEGYDDLLKECIKELISKRKGFVSSYKTGGPNPKNMLKITAKGKKHFEKLQSMFKDEIPDAIKNLEQEKWAAEITRIVSGHGFSLEQAAVLKLISLGEWGDCNDLLNCKKKKFKSLITMARKSFIEDHEEKGFWNYDIATGEDFLAKFSVMVLAFKTYLQHSFAHVPCFRFKIRTEMPFNWGLFGFFKPVLPSLANLPTQVLANLRVLIGASDIQKKYRTDSQIRVDFEEVLSPEQMALLNLAKHGAFSNNPSCGNDTSNDRFDVHLLNCAKKAAFGPPYLPYQLWDFTLSDETNVQRFIRLVNEEGRIVSGTPLLIKALGMNEINENNPVLKGGGQESSPFLEIFDDINLLSPAKVPEEEVIGKTAANKVREYVDKLAGYYPHLFIQHDIAPIVTFSTNNPAAIDKAFKYRVKKSGIENKLGRLERAQRAVYAFLLDWEDNRISEMLKSILKQKSELNFPFCTFFHDLHEGIFDKGFIEKMKNLGRILDDSIEALNKELKKISKE